MKKHTPVLITVVIVGIVIAIVAVLLSGGGDAVTESTGGGNGSETNGRRTEAAFDKAPEFSFPDFDGNSVSLADFPDATVRLVNSWAVWCPFCVDELPDFARLKQEFGGDVEIIAIDRAESVEKQKNFLATLEEDVTDDITFITDASDRFYRRMIGGIGMPETLFIDQDDNIRFHKRGPMTLEEMRRRVNDVLAAVAEKEPEDPVTEE